MRCKQRAGRGDAFDHAKHRSAAAILRIFQAVAYILAA